MSLARHTFRGLRWGVVSTGATVLLQVVSVATLARLLSPADFGVMAMALLSLRLAAFIAQAGVGAALVQKPQLHEDDVALALGWALRAGALMALLAWACAPAVATLFRTPALAPVLQWLALNVLLQALGSVPLALLRRGLRFRAVAAVEFGSYALGYVAVGVAAAWAGWGVRSLVAATLAQAVLGLAASWALAQPRWRVRWRSAGSAGLFGYSRRQAVIGLTEFLASNADTFALGRLLGEAALGVYSRAMLLAFLPLERVAGIVSRVLFPVLSRAQPRADGSARIGEVLLLGLSVIGLAGGAFGAGLAAASTDVVQVLLGPSWHSAAPVVRVLALGAPLIFLSNVCGVVCDALAWLRFKLRLQAAALVVLVPAVAVAAPHGPVAVAIAVVAVESLRLVVYLVVLPARLHCRRSDTARVLASVACSAGLVHAAVAAAHAGAASWGWPAAAALMLEAAAGTLALAGGALLWRGALHGRGPERLAAAHVPGWSRLQWQGSAR